MSYLWKTPDKIKQETLDLYPELHPIVAQLLFNRNLKTQEQIDEFLHPDYGQDIHDPFLFSDMDKACQQIYQAIENNQLITVYGDYDADGVSSAVILATILKKLGATVEVYLPHREREGYGLNIKAIEELSKNNTKLIITCDCGVTNIEEVEFAKEKDIKVIITDHHAALDKLPEAAAIIHPQVDEKYPFKFLAGGGVAFKLAQGLLHHKSNKLDDQDKEKQEKWLLDMVAISTVADMVPLLGENRTLVKFGLVVLKKTKRIGLQKLLEVAKLDPDKIDARSIGFTIAPRINAAGRMDHANLAYYLLMQEDESEAMKEAIELNNSNLARQRLTEQIIREAKEFEIDTQQSLLIFYKSGWPAGLTGLVAGRLSRDYSRPVFVLTDNNDQIVGSGRSIEGFNITDALQSNEDLLIKYGGHPQACGFTIDPSNLEEFKTKIQDIANQKLKNQKFQKTLDIEMQVNFEDINWDLADVVDKFSPFGKDNEEPLFVSKAVSISALRKVGKDQTHLKMEFTKADKKIAAIAFGMADRDLSVGDKVDIVYNLSINQWNGNREIQLMIKDIKQYES